MRLSSGFTFGDNWRLSSEVTWLTKCRIAQCSKSLKCQFHRFSKKLLNQLIPQERISDNCTSSDVFGLGFCAVACSALFFFFERKILFLGTGMECLLSDFGHSCENIHLGTVGVVMHGHRLCFDIAVVLIASIAI